MEVVVLVDQDSWAMFPDMAQWIREDKAFLVGPLMIPSGTIITETDLAGEQYFVLQATIKQCAEIKYSYLPSSTDINPP